MRLQFATTNLDQSENLWKNDLWTDETKIELYGHTSKRYVWRRKNEAFTDKTSSQQESMAAVASCFGAALQRLARDDLILLKKE